MRESAVNYADTLRIFELRYLGGVVSQVELSQALSQYQLALAAIPSIEQQIVAQENLISILLGRNPGSIPRGSTIDELIAPAVPPIYLRRYSNAGPTLCRPSRTS